MSEVYRPGASRTRRREKVDLSGGFYVWVREMTVAESTQIIERSQRPDIDPRGGTSTAMSVVLQIMLSCYEDETDTAKRVWDDTTRVDIHSLPAVDMFALLAAINRVNGMDATPEEIERDFTAATGGPNSSASTISASST